MEPLQKGSDCYSLCNLKKGGGWYPVCQQRMGITTE